MDGSVTGVRDVVEDMLANTSGSVDSSLNPPLPSKVFSIRYVRTRPGRPDLGGNFHLNAIHYV